MRSVTLRPKHPEIRVISEVQEVMGVDDLDNELLNNQIKDVNKKKAAFYVRGNSTGNPKEKKVNYKELLEHNTNLFNLMQGIYDSIYKFNRMHLTKTKKQ